MQSFFSQPSRFHRISNIRTHATTHLRNFSVNKMPSPLSQERRPTPERTDSNPTSAESPTIMKTTQAPLSHAEASSTGSRSTLMKKPEDLGATITPSPEKPPIPTHPVPNTSNDSHVAHPTLSPAVQIRATNLQTRISTLETQISDIKSKLTHSLSEFSKIQTTDSTSKTSNSPPTITEESQLLAQAETTVKQHIKLLHQYNEIRDVGLGLCGVIADQRGVRLQTVLDDYGMTSRD